METGKGIGREFEDIVFEILAFFFNGKVARISGRQDVALDFSIEELSIGGEIKFFSSLRLPNGSIERSVFRLIAGMRETGYMTGVLISTEIEEHEVVKFNSHLSILRWGLPELLFMSAGSPMIMERFTQFLKRALPFSRLEEIEMRRPNLGTIVDYFPDVPASQVAAGLDGEERFDFCEAVKRLKNTKADAKKFEALCAKALRYCLKDHFAVWKEQKRTDTGISIIDMVARISSVHDFWKMIRDDFKSPYVVFEFKWYKSPIGQGQIYTTEKYLYKNALRSVSFIVSGSGIDKNGRTAAIGALREHGKLIVPVTALQLCEMVKAKAIGDDPVTILSDIVDDILLGVER